MMESKNGKFWNKWTRGALGAIVGVAALAAYENRDAAALFLMGGSAYNCTNVIPEVVRISGETKGAIQVVGIGDSKLVSKTEDRLECTGTGVLATGQKVPLKYRAYVEYDQWWIVYEPA